MDREEFIHAVSGEQEPVRRFLLSLCNGDSFTADDIAQDTMLKAWMAADLFCGKSKLSTWLFRIAYNTWCDRKYVSCTENIDTKETLSKADENSPEDRFRYEPLYQAISELNPREKAAILLFYMEDKDIKEISSIMHIPAGTVKSLLSRGRAKLRIKLR